jgi:hypothetical protein
MQRLEPVDHLENTVNQFLPSEIVKVTQSQLPT